MIRAKILVPFLVVTLVGCGQSIPKDGFKTLHYGMELNELKALGFDCTVDYYFCSRTINHNRDDLEKFLGTNADVYVKTSKGRLSSINIKTQFTEKEVVELLSNEFGAYSSYDYMSYMAGMKKYIYWNNGDSASISMIVDKSGPSDAIANVTYSGPDETKEIISEALNNQVNEKDY